MNDKNAIDWIAIVLVIVGAVNWGLVAISPALDLVELLFGGYNMLSRIVYGLIGIAGLYMIYTVSKT